MCAQKRATQAMIAISIFLRLAAIEWNHLGLPHHLTSSALYNEHWLPSIFTLRRLWHLLAVRSESVFLNIFRHRCHWCERWSMTTLLQPQWKGVRCHGLRPPTERLSIDGRTVAPNLSPFMNLLIFTQFSHVHLNEQYYLMKFHCIVWYVKKTLFLISSLYENRLQRNKYKGEGIDLSCKSYFK